MSGAKGMLCYLSKTVLIIDCLFKQHLLILHCRNVFSAVLVAIVFGTRVFHWLVRSNTYRNCDSGLHNLFASSAQQGSLYQSLSVGAMVWNFRFRGYRGNNEDVTSPSDEQNITVQFLIVINLILFVKYRKKGSTKC